MAGMLVSASQRDQAHRLLSCNVPASSTAVRVIGNDNAAVKCDHAVIHSWGGWRTASSPSSRFMQARPLLLVIPAKMRLTPQAPLSGLVCWGRTELSTARCNCVLLAPKSRRTLSDTAPVWQRRSPLYGTDEAPWMYHS